VKTLATSLALLLLVTAAAFAQGADPQDRALGASMSFLRAHSRDLGLDDPQADLKVRQSFADDLGQTHIRYRQHYQGVPVFGAEAISHVDGTGNVTLTNGLRGNLHLDTAPSVAEALAVALAVRTVGPRGGFTTASSLEILAGGDRTPSSHLVWHVVVSVDNDVDEPSEWNLFVDAKTGRVVWAYDDLQTTSVSGTARTQYLGSIAISVDRLSSTSFLLRDLTRSGNRTCDLNNATSGTCTTFSSSTASFGDGIVDGTSRVTSGADAHAGLQFTWDYYRTIHGRNGIDGAGTATVSRVHYSTRYDNAFWNNSCFCMTYGDGSGTPGGTTGFLPLVALDVAGHEMSHGVTSRTANLVYSGESGGLNESTSDIFGTMVEFFANSASDTPDYLIGEKIKPQNYTTTRLYAPPLSGEVALRYMAHPSLDGRSVNCWSSTIGSLNVHASSGPNNHMFYLLAHGGTSACNGRVVTGIGNSAAQRIWYRALTVYMTPSTNYAGARTAAIRAANDLFGSGSVQSAAVAAAYTAINVN